VGVPSAWSWEEAGGVGVWRLAAWEAEGCTALFSSRLGGVSEGPFATLNLGLAVGDAPERVRENLRRFAAAAGVPAEALAAAEQVHGTEVVAAERPGFQGQADALVTDRPGVALSVQVADCCAVFLWDPVRGAVGLCHAGWRGVVRDAVGRAVAALAARYGAEPARLRAAVAPSIGPCCYEVDEPVLRALASSAPWAEAVLHPSRRPGRRHLDLREAVVRRLADAGVPRDAVAVEPTCTACARELLFSYRRDGGRTGRMRALIALPGPARSAASLARTCDRP